MQKRGSTLTLKPVVEMLIAAIVIAAFLAVGQAYGSQEIFQKSRAARDVALAVDMLYKMPDQAWVEIPYDVAKYSFDFLENYVKVSELKGEVDAATYTYVTDGKLKTQAVDKPDSLILSIDNGEFKASNTWPKFNTYRCGKTKKKLVDQRIQFEIEPAFDLTMVKINSELGGKTVVGCTGCSSLAATDSETIYIQLKSGEAGKFNAYFYYDSEESRDLGCMILNKLAEKYPEAKTSLVPSDELEDKKDKTNLILKLGETDALKVGAAVAEATGAYYG